MRKVVGWDIGGAHVKTARIDDGRVVDVWQEACPLWLGLDRLEAVVETARARLGGADLHVVTMTGELADVFASRVEGVAAITARMQAAVSPVRIYAGRAGFVHARQAVQHAEDIASANWHASAALVARSVPDALFVDMGSTTTDLVPIARGSVAATGYTDAERLACGEMSYTGLTRGFVMSLCRQVPFQGAWTTLACEHFATTADVYRILGELAEDADQMPTADGREKTVDASCARLARMIGRDASDADFAAWHRLAAWFAEMQMRLIGDDAMLVLSRACLPRSAPLIGAGIGQHVVARLAARLGCVYREFGELSPPGSDVGNWLGRCAPAVAVALLAIAEDGAMSR